MEKVILSCFELYANTLSVYQYTGTILTKDEKFLTVQVLVAIYFISRYLWQIVQPLWVMCLL